MKPVFFKTPAEFRKWLEKNHTKETELWVGYYKVGTGKASMNWSESVDQALCFGWIDGIRKSIDEESYTNRFTPRKTGSNWSEINIDKVNKLKKAGLMSAAGLEAFAGRKGNKSKVYSYEKDPMLLDAGYLEIFKKNKTAWKFFAAQAPSYKSVMIHWIMSAKQEKTRLSRLERTITESALQKRMQ